MMKDKAFAVLFVSILLWSSASAKSQDVLLNNLINSYTQYAIEEMKEVPELYKIRLTNVLQGAKNEAWDNFADYLSHIDSVVRKVVKQADLYDIDSMHDKLSKGVSTFIKLEEAVPLSADSEDSSESKELFDYVD